MVGLMNCTPAALLPPRTQLVFSQRFNGRNYTPVFATNVTGASTSDNNPLRTMTDLNATESIKFSRIQISRP